jgi:NAD(P)-dependent dehydrogenase (short-subunit alcohol dehydrogenase family)
MELTPDSVLLTDRVAVVTGAAQGIGAATARALARFGAHVAICDTNGDQLPDTAQTIESLGRRCVAGVLDVRDDEKVDRFLGLIVDQLGPIEVLVTNVGGGFRHRSTMSLPKVRPRSSARTSERSRTVCVTASVG